MGLVLATLKDEELGKQYWAKYPWLIEYLKKDQKHGSTSNPTFCYAYSPIGKSRVSLRCYFKETSFSLFTSDDNYSMNFIDFMIENQFNPTKKSLEDWIILWKLSSSRTN